MLKAGKIFQGHIVSSVCCGCDPLRTHPSHFSWLDFQCLSIQRTNHHMISNRQQNCHCTPAPLVSLFLSYFLLLPFSYSPPSKGLEGVSGSQRLLFLLSLSDLCEGWKQLSAVGLTDWVMTETDSCKSRYTSPVQHTLLSKGVIIMWVRVFRSNRSKTPLSTFHLYV